MYSNILHIIGSVDNLHLAARVAWSKIWRKKFGNSFFFLRNTPKHLFKLCLIYSHKICQVWTVNLIRIFCSPLISKIYTRVISEVTTHISFLCFWQHWQHGTKAGKYGINSSQCFVNNSRWFVRYFLSYIYFSKADNPPLPQKMTDFQVREQQLKLLYHKIVHNHKIHRRLCAV